MRPTATVVVNLVQQRSHQQQQKEEEELVVVAAVVVSGSIRRTQCLGRPAVVAQRGSVDTAMARWPSIHSGTRRRQSGSLSSRQHPRWERCPTPHLSHRRPHLTRNRSQQTCRQRRGKERGRQERLLAIPRQMMMQPLLLLLAQAWGRTAALTSWVTSVCGWKVLVVTAVGCGIAILLTIPLLAG
jgi:hypothetical protein